MRAFICAAAMLCAAALPAAAQTAPSPAALTDLAPTGKLRAAINFGNPVLAQKGPNGEQKGVSAELAAGLAKALGVPLDYVKFEAAGKAFAALAKGEVDVAFIAIEPARAAEVTFSPPYVLIQGTYMVRQDSPLKDVGDVDKPGIKIGVGLASVYDLYLTRTLKHATLVRAKVGGASAGIPLFLEQHLDAAAGVREPLDAYAKDHPEMRVMPGAFEQIAQAMVTQKGKPAGAAYVHAFVEAMKANGMVADALKRSGQKAPVAPKAN
jgi:polar amino acid transport system substrate-binding protein